MRRNLRSGYLMPLLLALASAGRAATYQTFVLSNEGGNGLVWRSIAAGLGNLSVFETLTHIQGNTDPSVSGIVTDSFLQALYGNPASSPVFVVVLYANGFGPTTVPVVSGAVSQSGVLTPLPVVTIAGATATVQFAGLVAPGEFQFNVLVPASTPDGDQSITASYAGLTTQPGTLITIQY